MYLRHTTRRKDGKIHQYWRLVRSVRVGRKVIQQTVAQLGELDADGRARARALARAITGAHEQPDLFDPPEPEAVIPVRLKRLRPERGRTFGDVWLGWTLWRALRALQQWQRRAGLGQSPRTVLDELRRIQSTDVVLPTDDGRALRLRCVVRPDSAQAALLDRLGLTLPKRLRIRPPLLQTAEV